MILYISNTFSYVWSFVYILTVNILNLYYEYFWVFICQIQASNQFPPFPNPYLGEDSKGQLPLAVFYIIKHYANAVCKYINMNYKKKKLGGLWDWGYKSLVLFLISTDERRPYMCCPIPFILKNTGMPVSAYNL